MQDTIEYVQAATLRTGAPIHIVDHYGEGMRIITACGRHLFWPNFTDEPAESSLCLTCAKVSR